MLWRCDDPQANPRRPAFRFGAFARRCGLFRHPPLSALLPARVRSRPAIALRYAAFLLNRARSFPILATPARRRSRNSIVLSCDALSFSQ